MRSQFPDQGLKLHLLQWKPRVLTTGPPGKYPSLRVLNSVKDSMRNRWLTEITVIQVGLTTGTICKGIRTAVGLPWWLR